MPGGYIPGVPPIYPINYMTLGVSPNMSCLEPADSNCTYGIHWIWVSMGLCVMDAKGGIALFCGILCLFIWIAVGIPQIIENFRTGIADKALSLGFLFFWTFGDILNLIGCFLTHQLIMQIVVTGYCVISDFVLVFQFIYYKIRHNAVLRQMATVLKDGEISPSPSTASPTIFEDSEQYNSHREYRRLPICFVGAASFTLAVISLTSVENPFNTYFIYQQTPRSSHYQSRQLLEWEQYESTDYPSIDSDPLDGTVIKVGYILGWISTCMYLFSRLPQLFRNWKRRSTEGLSMFMFSMTITGNISYGVQILLTSTEKNFLIRATPWIVGSLGVVLLDTLALLDDHDACEVWRSRDRLQSSLIAIFPAALIGEPITVTLLDETRITGRLCSCDGMMNIQLDSGVIIRNPNSDRLNEFIQVE
ncbi:Lysosomal amino acid transporter 1 [Schistosoma japonicum]|uniref:Lysosomal amino acid transporter 1 n=1 Tax=Schistosoma japonicum TaxID=6182 RepID=A0A4Z2CN66_SCHJA|nr:Lysosomal amino acid transporter 1 [Schistosoma japonicum]